jgi:hypothetical protein
MFSELVSQMQQAEALARGAHAGDRITVPAWL